MSNLPKYRPVVLIGYGYRLMKMSHLWKVPMLTTWRAADVLPDDHPLFFGRPGSIAPKYANLIIQNATHLHVEGARLDLPQVGYQPENFAPSAKREIIWPFDECGQDWIDQCRAWKEQYPLGPSWVDEISDAMGPDDVLVPSSSGMACEMICQRFKVKFGQRVIFSPGLGSMGFGLPQAIGVALASGRRVFCVEGDGSIQMSINCLHSIKQYGLDIRLYIVENNGYLSIRNMQKSRFDGRLFGCDPSSGLTFPDIEKICEAYGVKVKMIRVDPNLELSPRLRSKIVDGKIIPGRLEDVE